MGPRTAHVADRVAWLVLLVTALVVLGLSRALSPSPSGVGTHEQLGLPPCGLLLWLGLPCPACGLTTAFAHLAHFELEASLAANPIGLPLFLATLLFVPLAAHALWRGRTLLFVIDATEADKWSLRFVIAALLVWGARLLSHAS